MNAIQQWFDSGCPYIEGVKLYTSLPRHNRNIARLLSRNETKANLLKLKYNLKQLSNAPIVTQPKPVTLITKRGLKIKPKAPAPPPTKTATVQAKQPTNHQPVYFHDLPEELRPVLLQANKLFKELCLLKVQLNEQPEKAVDACNAIQIQIHNKRKQNEVCWCKIDYFQKHRQLPPVSANAFKKLSPAKLLQKYQYADQNISKNRSRLTENKKLLETATTVAEKTKIGRKIAKQEANILKYKEQQVELKVLIDGEK